MITSSSSYRTAAQTELEYLRPAAEEVCAAGGAAGAEDGLPLLGRLVEQLLVAAERGSGATRYRMLEPVLHYELEKPEEGCEADEVMRRHALGCLALAEKAEPRIKGREQVEWPDTLEAENDNLRAAIDRALEAGEAQTAARFGWGRLSSSPQGNVVPSAQPADCLHGCLGEGAGVRCPRAWGSLGWRWGRHRRACPETPSRRGCGSAHHWRTKMASRRLRYSGRGQERRIRRCSTTFVEDVPYGRWLCP